MSKFFNRYAISLWWTMNFRYSLWAKVCFTLLTSLILSVITILVLNFLMSSHAIAFWALAVCCAVGFVTILIGFAAVAGRYVIDPIKARLFG